MLNELTHKPKFAEKLAVAAWPTKDEIREYLLEFKRKRTARLAVDLETTGLDPHQAKITVVGMSFDGNLVVIARPEDIPEDVFCEIMEDPDLVKVMHNAKFDCKFLHKRYGCKFKNVDDTYIMRRLLVTGLDVSSTLDACAYEYLGYKMDKAVRAEFIGATTITDKMVRYAAIDVAATYELQPILLDLLEQEQMTEVYAFIEKPLVQVVGAMELEGVDVDLAYLKQLEKMLIKKIARFQSDLDDLCFEYDVMPKKQRKLLKRELLAMGQTYDRNTPVIVEEAYDEFNVNSSKQVVELLNKIGFDVKSGKAEVLDEPTYTKVSAERGMQQLDVDTLDDMLEVGHDFITRIKDLRSARKALSGFVVPMQSEHINPATGRVHCDFSQMGTNTGRFSCKNPNFQQMPSTRKDKIFEGMTFRRAFVAPPGYKLLCYDYQACELRIAAEMTGDAGLITAMSEDDPHRFNASILFDVPVDQVSAEQRVAIKTLIFTWLYGGGAKRVAAILKKPIEYAKHLIALMQSRFPDVNDWSIQRKAAVVRDGFSLSLSGRKRYFPIPEAPSYSSFDYHNLLRIYRGTLASIERKGQNMPIQATNADITKLAMVWVAEEFERVPEADAKLLLQVHDELIAKVREEYAEMMSELMGEAMLRAEREFLHNVPAKIDGCISTFWEH